MIVASPPSTFTSNALLVFSSTRAKTPWSRPNALPFPFPLLPVSFPYSHLAHHENLLLDAFDSFTWGQLEIVSFGSLLKSSFISAIYYPLLAFVPRPWSIKYPSCAFFFTHLSDALLRPSISPVPHSLERWSLPNPWLTVLSRPFAPSVGSCECYVEIQFHSHAT